MDRITSRYVRFLAPGSFFAEEWSRPVETLDPRAVAWPDNAYAFSLHERVDVHDGPDVFIGKSRQIGPLYYHPDSKVVTLEEVAARNDLGDRILLDNMRINKWPSVIYSRWGNWPQPFDAEKMAVLALHWGMS